MSEAEEIEQLDELAEEVRITRLGPAPGSLPAPRRQGPTIPARAAAVAAAGSFMAGAAVVGIVSRRQRRSTALARGGRTGLLASRRRSARRSRPAGELLQIVETRRLLLDVHLLGPLDPDR